MKRALITLAITAAAAAALAWAPAPAHAEGGCDDEASESGEFVIKERNGQKVYVIKDAITVCGKVPRPSVVYVLQPRTINYEWQNLKQDFKPKILDAVKKAPF